VKIHHLIYIAVLLILQACNLPQQVSSPTEDKVATVVAQTITAMPSNTVAPTLISTVPLPTPTTVLPTETPQPSPTATGLPGDLKITLGIPSGKDNLDNGKGFGIGAEGYEDEGVRITLDNGTLAMASISSTGWRSWRVRPPDLQDFYIDATFIADLCSDNDQYGLVVRTQGYESGAGYYFGITCDGNYSFTRWDSSGTVSLAPASAFGKILTGSGQSNRLGVLARGNSFNLYLNGEEVQEISDSTFQKGYFGVFVSGYSGSLKVRLDEISYWSNP